MRILFALMLLLTTTAPTMAQTPEVVAEIESLLQKERKSVDVEVLRRLLNQRFGFADKVEVQPPAPNSWVTSAPVQNLNLLPNTYFHPLTSGHGTPDNFANPRLQIFYPIRPQLSQIVGPFDGTVIPGGGVVYALRIPAGAELTFDAKTNVVGLGNNCGRCHVPVPHEPASVDAAHHPCPVQGQTTAANCSACHDGGLSAKDIKNVAPPSDWERVKFQVGVEKVENTRKPATKPKSERMPMCQPGDVAEQVIQVLAANAKNLGQLAKTERLTVVVTFDELPTVKVVVVLSGNIGYSQDESQAVNIGIIHLRQQKYKEAAEAFEKGLVRFNEGVITVFAPAGTTEGNFQQVRDFQTSIRGMYKDLSQAYLKLDQLDQASKALGLAKTFRIEFAKSPAAPKPKLPAKLIVSILKSDIDSAKSLDDFRKVTTVERSGFPALKK